jgi:hypothetical protein
MIYDFTEALSEVFLRHTEDALNHCLIANADLDMGLPSESCSWIDLFTVGNAATG